MHTEAVDPEGTCITTGHKYGIQAVIGACPGVGVAPTPLHGSGPGALARTGCQEAAVDRRHDARGVSGLLTDEVHDRAGDLPGGAVAAHGDGVGVLLAGLVAVQDASYRGVDRSG